MTDNRLSNFRKQTAPAYKLACGYQSAQRDEPHPTPQQILANYRKQRNLTLAERLEAGEQMAYSEPLIEGRGIFVLMITPDNGGYVVELYDVRAGRPAGNTKFNSLNTLLTYLKANGYEPELSNWQPASEVNALACRIAYINR